MKRQIWKTAFIMLFTVFLATCSLAGDIDFNFEIPTIPYPPDITEVTNSPAVVGASTFKVSAKIEGQMQKTGKCDIVPKSSCTASDWYQIDDPTIVPNPPQIKSAKVYYFNNGDTATSASVAMTFDSELGKWVGNVPINPTLIQGDSISYFVLAIDGRGNVASETPSTGEEPCSDIGSWDDTLATPLVDSCAVATGYNQCNVNQPTGPGNCGTSYTLGDKAGDVCGEPNASGVQSVITGANADKVDLLGITAGSGSSVICTKIGLGAPPPASTDNAPIEGYLMIFFNPDIPDPNPGDTHIENAYAITYAPEAVGSDPTLVKVLWSGDCVTDPNTSDPLGCKLISAVGDHPNLKIGYQSGSLRFITKKTGTGSPYAVSYSLIGSTSGKSILVGITGEINLSGGTAFWISDLTAGFSYYNRNKTVTIEPPGEPPAPAITKTSCNETGTATGVKVCPKSTTQPSVNKCRIDFRQSDMPDITDEYRVYRNTTDNSSSATKVGTVPDVGGTTTYSYPDSHTTLDGSTFYYYLTSYNSAATKETKMANASKTNCTVEDWVPPSAPTITTAATPAGTTGKCKITFTVSAGDSSLSKFWISRDGTVINPSSPLSATTGVTEYNYSDSAELTNGVGVSYRVTAVDRGNNTAESAPMTCTPQDLKPPSNISSLLAGNIPGDVGVKMEWEASTEDDAAGYNAYWCSKATVDCKDTAHYTKFNSSLLTSTSLEKNKAAVPGLGGTSGTGGDFCFYVEACDTNSNCSGFPPGGADNTNVKCFTLSEVADTIKPAFPQGVTCTTPAEGGKVLLEWEKVCTQSDGTWFSSAFDNNGKVDCLIPAPLDLQGYKVIFAEGTPPAPEAAQCANIAGSTAAYNDVDIEHKTKTCGTTTVALLDGHNYCYHVYAVDAYNNVSVNGTVSRMEVCCTPNDTLDPTPPTATMTSDETFCEPHWTAVNDKDGAANIRYSVYKCAAGASCNAASTWETVVSDRFQDLGLSYNDPDIDPELTYTYCITAKDLADNESDVFPATSQPNCKVCVPGVPLPNGPTAVTALISGETGANYGALVYWTKSPDDNGSAAEGYKMYRCSDSACNTKTAIAGKGCSDLAANSSTITNLGFSNPITLTGEPVGDWYYGVTFCEDTAAESIFGQNNGEDISEKITIDSPPVTCETKCIHISTCKDYNDLNTSCSPIGVIDTTQKGSDGKFLSAPKSGVEVFVADSSNQVVGTAASTDSNGNIHLVLDNNSGGVTLTDKYKIVMKVAAAEKAGVPCDDNFFDTEGNCFVVLQKNVTLTDDDAKTTRVYGVNLPPAGGGRAEIGNPNCDSVVDTSDLVLLKPGFGSELGDPNYKTYLDFDGNGIIELDDFLILKKYYGNALPEAPSFDATLCKPQ